MPDSGVDLRFCSRSWAPMEDSFGLVEMKLLKEEFGEGSITGLKIKVSFFACDLPKRANRTALIIVPNSIHRSVFRFC